MMDDQRDFSGQPAEPAFLNAYAEQALLGAVLHEPSRIDAMGDLADRDLFADQAHAALFAVMRRQHRGGERVSLASLAEFARQHPGMQELGGQGYLVNLMGGAVSTYAFMDYAKTLDDARQKRRIAAILDNAYDALEREEVRPGDVASQVEGALVAERSTSRSVPVSMLRAVTDAIEQVNAAYQGEELPGVRSGIGALDALIGQMSAGEMWILGGRPSMGKTAVALSVALFVARSGRGVAIASLEMAPEALALRALAEQTAQSGVRGGAVEYASMRAGDMSEPQMRGVVEAAKVIAELPISILPMAYRDIGAIMSGVRQAKASIFATTGLHLLIVDYVQLVQMAGTSRYEKITEVSIALKALAAQLGIPVLVLAQLNRGVEQRDDKRPLLSDLKESGQLEQDADGVMFCYRDEYYLERDQPDPSAMAEYEAWQQAMERSRNKLEIIVAKQRQGPIGVARVRFNPALNLIWDGAHG